jgi:hypothetical protein
MSNYLSKSILSGLALAGLGVALLAGAGPAEARKTACQVKYSACNSRCMGAYNDPFPCIQRTCDRQYDNCAAAEGVGGGGKGGKGGRAGLVGSSQPNFSPRTTNPGPLPQGGVKPTQNGGIVTGGVRPNGGGMRPFASGRR